MKLCKVVKTAPVPTGGTATHTIGWYLVENGQAVKVELWKVYTPKVCENEKEQEAENARVHKKQADNWRKLELFPYHTLEGFDGLKEVCQKSKQEMLDRLALENEFSKK